MAKTTTKQSTKRGSPEAIAKSAATRALNQLFSATTGPTPLDGRTLKRKQRLVDELQQGRKGQPLKATEALSHMQELLGLDETVSSLRKLKPKLPLAPSMSDAFAQAVWDAQNAYAFDPGVWKLLGVNLDKVPAPSTSA